MEEINENLIPEQDRDFLDRKNYDYEIVSLGGAIYIIFKNFDFPQCYNPQKADLLVILPPGYPNSAVDMFWTNPDVKLLNNNLPKSSEHHEAYLSRNWQRWSRHLIWRAGIDNLRSFIAAVNKELNQCI